MQIISIDYGNQIQRRISIYFYKQHYKKTTTQSNNAIKGKDKCFDYQIWLFGLCINYYNFNYDKS